MIKYPLVEINLNKIEHNTRELVKYCNKYNIKVAAVTKVFCAEKQIVESIVKGGVSLLADSRIENIMNMKKFKLPKLLLRLPMISQVEEVVEYADISLNSHIETIKCLSEVAIKKGKVHKVILMIDLGDLREGIFNNEEIIYTVDEILKLKGVELIGLGTNLTCYGGVIPTEENLGKLVNIKKDIENRNNIKLEIISGGNSSSLYLVGKREIPKEINQLRLGESIVLGRETAYGNRINRTYDDCFILSTEIIEIRDKPSVPIGEIGMDAFGNKPSFDDRGIRRRAICAIGKQDIDINDLIPIDKKIDILGASSDHLILDVTESGKSYRIGDIIHFKLTYGGILRTMTSKYVQKEYVCK